VRNLNRAAAAVLFLLLTAAFASAQPNLDDVVARAMKEFNVPGIAVGVIQDGTVAVAKGYGVRRLGDPAPVDEKTLFGIASNTKAFTAAALAILADAKKIDWDQRVIDVLPGFQMSDPYVTREMRVRDLLVHRSGLALGAGDLMYFPDSTLTAGDVLHRLRHVPLTYTFRSRYAYDNILYVVAGAVIEQASGMPWAQFIRERILSPLEMSRTYTLLSEVPPGANIASPHALEDGVLRPIQPTTFNSAAPAGSLVSSVEDMFRWVRMQLAQGEYSSGRLFSATQSNEMWTPHIFIPIPARRPAELEPLRPNFQAYALGWSTYDFRGERIVHHTGGLNGMVTRVTLVPSRKLGIVVLTNQQEGGAFQSITQTILDHYLSAPARDWVSAYASVRSRQVKDAAETVAKAYAARNPKSKPSLPLSRYAGRYRDAWYGDVVIEEKGDKLFMRFTHSPALTGTMEHFQYDTFVAKWNDRSQDADAYVTFSLNPDGSVDRIRMKAISPATDFSYDFHDLDLKPAPTNAPAYD
jgi:CubicO group peptidase (beta-lactamase class C family)